MQSVGWNWLLTGKQDTKDDYLEEYKIRVGKVLRGSKGTDGRDYKLFI